MTERLRQIRTAIDEIFSTDNPKLDLCATLEIPSNTNHWVQVTREEVNLAYPFEDEPLGRLASSGLAGFELLAWEPKLYATFRHAGRNAEIVAGFVDAWFSEVLGSTGSDLSLTMDDLAG